MRKGVQPQNHISIEYLLTLYPAGVPKPQTTVCSVEETQETRGGRRSSPPQVQIGHPPLGNKFASATAKNSTLTPNNHT